MDADRLSTIAERHYLDLHRFGNGINIIPFDSDQKKQSGNE